MFWAGTFQRFPYRKTEICRPKIYIGNLKQNNITTAIVTYFNMPAAYSPIRR